MALDLLLGEHDQHSLILMGVSEKGDAFLEKHLPADRAWGGACLLNKNKYVTVVLAAISAAGLKVSPHVLSSFRPMS